MACLDSDTEEQRAYLKEVHACAHHDGHLSSPKLSFLSRAKERLKSEYRMVGRLANVDKDIEAEMKDPSVHPELHRCAQVRRGQALCEDEVASIAKRRRTMAPLLKRFLELDEDVHPDDVPIIGLGGSGGGFRAMLGLLGTMKGMHKGGEWDLLQYVAGVSGSCWAIAAYYTWGHCDVDAVLKHFGRHSKQCVLDNVPVSLVHLASRSHPLSPHAIHSVLRSLDGPIRTLGPITAKTVAGMETRLMDLYGAFLTSWFWLPSRDEVSEQKDRGIEPEHLKWTNARPHLDDGQQPIPLLTAVRHERPWEDWASSEHPFANPDHNTSEHEKAVNAWYQWFELSPYECGSDELAAWCPTWAFGRRFDDDASEHAIPEHSLGLLLGLCTSAPAGPLSAYLGTLQRNLPKGFVSDTVERLSERIAESWGPMGVEEFENHHPLHASSVHNFAHQETGGATGVARARFLELIDSGLDCNTPMYTLTRNEREVDIIINFDASSDVQKGTFGDADGPLGQFGRRKGLRYSKRESSPETLCSPAHGEKVSPEARAIADKFAGQYAQIFDCSPTPQEGEQSHNTPPLHRDVALLYLPLLPSSAVPDYDPSTAKFSGSYNLCWTQEQVDAIETTSMANWGEARATFKLLVEQAYERRKRDRLARAVSGAEAMASAEMLKSGAERLPDSK